MTSTDDNHWTRLFETLKGGSASGTKLHKQYNCSFTNKSLMNSYVNISHFERLAQWDTCVSFSELGKPWLKSH